MEYEYEQDELASDSVENEGVIEHPPTRIMGKVEMMDPRAQTLIRLLSLDDVLWSEVCPDVPCSQEHIDLWTSRGYHADKVGSIKIGFINTPKEYTYPMVLEKVRKMKRKG